LRIAEASAASTEGVSVKDDLGACPFSEEVLICWLLNAIFTILIS